ncbi:xanthine dehydrogenase family protein subunit M [Nocardia flavorosea]|uniref:FAD binding domain-containing protein n=1 Tax=Nocardia flavorosea TaxID=53429 RepID=UPI001894D4A7|nr:xanthine dehydrogenase family protein subunit M [Nocardia flavorosea]MBF6347530.1 xanthine dehydrogenase family protein subunit M [Nocardia flavorosea]
MIPFEYRRATSAQEAVAAVAERPGAAFLGGGTNLVDHMKLGIAAPELLVDVSRLPLDGIEETAGGGLRVGAAVRNSDLAAHPVVRARYPALSRALLSGASGQLRNLATTGGNLLQRTRCVYFQDVTTPCNKRDPGSGCSALGGYVRYHAILGASEHCVAVHPSDMAVALAALDARVVTESTDGEQRIPVADFHRLPGDHPERDTVLSHGQLITAIEIPAPPAGVVADYRKVRDRASYAFALVSVAAELALESGGTIRSARLAFGGVAHRPWRARRAEAELTAAPATEHTFERAADAELADARPLDGNEFKVELARRTLVSTLQTLTEQAQQ